jgi:hypothetical protein
MNKISIFLVIALFATFCTNNSNQHKSSAKLKTDTVQTPKNIVQSQNTGTNSGSVQNDSGKTEKPLNNIADLYKEFEKPLQSFSVKSNRDTTIIGKQNTKIEIPADAFFRRNRKTGKRKNYGEFARIL